MDLWVTYLISVATVYPATPLSVELAFKLANIPIPVSLALWVGQEPFSWSQSGSFCLTVQSSIFLSPPAFYYEQQGRARVHLLFCFLCWELFLFCFVFWFLLKVQFLKYIWLFRLFSSLGNVLITCILQYPSIALMVLTRFLHVVFSFSFTSQCACLFWFSFELSVI